MHPRLFHQLFLLITATALVSVLSMAAVMALNLQRGFDGYLAARDAEELDMFVALASRKIAEGGGASALRSGRVTLQAMLHDLARSHGHPARPGMPPLGMASPPKSDRRAWPPPPRGANGRRPPPPEDFGARVILFDGSRKVIAGPPGAAEVPAGGGMTRSIKIDGQTVALAQILPRAPASGGVETRFLQSQYQGALALAALLTALGALATWRLARRGAQRLGRVKRATDAIADGDFTFRLPTHGKDEVDDVAHNVNRMAESLERLDPARRRWLAEVSHELRTPLAAIRGELDALEDGVRALEAPAILSLNAEARRLSGLVDDLHFLAMSDLPGQQCHFAPVDSVALCRSATARFAEQAKAAGIVLSLDAAEGLEGHVRWDGGRISQVLANLLTNSLRYTDSPGQIRVALDPVADRIRLTVEDSAPGVDAQHLEALFAPLYRLDTARDRMSAGSGLGLSVSEAIVRAHGGTIVAQPSSLGGLAIRIALPREAVV